MFDDESNLDLLQKTSKRVSPFESDDETSETKIDIHIGKKICDSIITIGASQNEEIHKYQFAELSLKPIRKKSDGDVWKYFGIAQKNDKPIPALENKIICKQCFEKRIWKRYICFRLEYRIIMIWKMTDES